ncbi:deoxycytidylate deaminase [Mahella australiensis]|uniref:CMP/dCMP deaminase zinc-binding protein n=1 Tax=Mahella australiensis (strain DSM 15567 / CIP 107919 / 50-1 BON) TaxID=697281 RepID=F3ZX21_MAHA5|nr:cytidine/deoxycytidylate deaminase family protein [Mahella australiensis]AEE95470.1 CMP/dCMP deaminase zinc-binding protein [Mahella australiensis 50-1 BON]
MRPSWDEYFMNMVEIVKTRSTCLRRQVGAIIVKDKRMLASGYNGAPSGVRHCDEVGCLREQMHIPSGQRQELCRAIHAEQNAIAQAAMMGISVKDATIYITTQPCAICAKMIINAGITRIVYKGDYPDALAMDLLREAGIEVARFEDGNLVKVRLEPLPDDENEAHGHDD